MPHRLSGRTAVLHDNRPVQLDALARVVRGLGVTVVAAAADFDEALELADRVRPDLLATVVTSPDQVENVRAALEREPTLKVVVFASGSGEGVVEAALDAGAAAVVLARTSPEDVGVALRQLFDRSIHLARDYTPGAHVNGDEPELLSLLTRREREILRLVADGMPNAAIARSLWVTEQTVKFHLSNVFKKLGVANRTEASRWAHRHGVLERLG